MRTCRTILVCLLALPAGLLPAQGRRLPPPLVAVAILEGGLAIQSMQDGFAQPLLNLVADSGVVLWPGAPLVQGRGSLAIALQSLPGTVRRAAVTMQALRRELAPDSSLVFDWGVLAFAADTTLRPPPAVGRFMAVWQPVKGGWRLAAFNAFNLPPAFTVGMPLPTGSIGPVDSVDRFVRADKAFAARAAAIGIDSAFAAAASHDAVTFRGDGGLNQGPTEVAAALRRRAGDRWTWTPMAAGATADGSMGWTAGEAVITLTGRNGAKPRELRSKYLTFWRVVADGSIRFFVDAGSDRP